jgi:hypoxanthine-guanine phosphoribosyltransferase
MKAHYMAHYYSSRAVNEFGTRPQGHWDAYKFCRTVKTGTINGFLHVPKSAGSIRIDESNVARARQLFGEFIMRKIKEAGLQSVVAIPVPSKDGLRGAADFRSYSMLRECLAQYPNITVFPGLRYRTAMGSASKGGPRSRLLLDANTVVAAAIPEGSILLVDDIVTTGNSMASAFHSLRKSGRQPACAVSCGYTILTKEDCEKPCFGDFEREL